MTCGLLLMKALVGADNSIDGIAGQTGPVQQQVLAKRLAGHRSFLVSTC
jgi:hypothetical protein